MKKLTLLLLIPLFLSSLSMSAQSKRDVSLKSLSILYQKNKEETRAALEIITKENEELSSENRMLIIELEDATHRLSFLSDELEKVEKDAGNLEKAELAKAEQRIAELEKELILVKSNRARNQVKDIEVLAMARPANLNSFGPDLSASDGDPIPQFSSKANFDAPFSNSTILEVNINTATEREIKMIPGVGGNLAKNIIANRPYDSIWGLMKLDNIGKKRIEILSSYITVE